MIKLTLFNTLTVAIFKRCILQITLDTSRMPFSFDLKLGLFYSVLPWFNNMTGKEIGGIPHRVIDILFPFLFDLRLYIEQ